MGEEREKDKKNREKLEYALLVAVVGTLWVMYNDVQTMKLKLPYTEEKIVKLEKVTTDITKTQEDIKIMFTELKGALKK